MLETDLKYLGECIFSARKKCDLTQKELASQTQLSVKTIQDIEKGDKNPTYDTLLRLIVRLGISPDTIFHMNAVTTDDELQLFIEKYRSCNQKNRKILLETLKFLAELLLNEQYHFDDTE